MADDKTPIDVTLRTIMEGTGTARGENFFRSLVQYLAISLKVDVAFVAQFTPDRASVQTLSVWIGESHADNIEFATEGTPCKFVLSGEIQHFGDCVQDTFPSNELLKQLNARSYLAIPLIDDGGVVQGHLAVIDSKPWRASFALLCGATLTAFGLIHSIRPDAALYLPWQLAAVDQSIVMQWAMGYVVLALLLPLLIRSGDVRTR